LAQGRGFEPTLIEHARELRAGGYVVDFWGLGYDIAERMGLLPEIERAGYHIRVMRIVNGRGERIAGFGTGVLNDLTGGRFATCCAFCSTGSVGPKLSSAMKSLR
jgi:2-polyprenyl-6-methoxyphenol hydroxylase-like FAD-dependent oxidoreductase